MKLNQPFKIGLLFVVGLALVANGYSQTSNFTNSNFGLLPGESQFLTVINPHSAIVDQFNYVVTGPFDYTTPTLSRGVVYDIRISGRAGYGPRDGENNSTPDAAYCFVNWQDLDLVHIPCPTTVAGWDGIDDRRPSLDVYSTAHIYDYYIEGHDAGLAFSFRDNPYSDNIGGFQVSIFEQGQIAVVPEPSGIALLVLGLTGLMILRLCRRSSTRRNPAC